jgi:hypothetical protein
LRALFGASSSAAGDAELGDGWGVRRTMTRQVGFSVNVLSRARWLVWVFRIVGFRIEQKGAKETKVGGELLTEAAIVLRSIENQEHSGAGRERERAGFGDWFVVISFIAL